MQETRNEDLEDAIVKAAIQLSDWNLHWTTGISPSEMGFFLGACEKESVELIIESGRGPDAYSTHCLGHYTNQNKAVRALSVVYAPLSKLFDKQKFLQR